jgi:hypothetical protein
MRGRPGDAGGAAGVVLTNQKKHQKKMPKRFTLWLFNIITYNNNYGKSIGGL